MASGDYEFWFTCGISKPISHLQFLDKEKIVTAMCLHYSVLVTLAELEQLHRGLTIQRFNVLMQSYPQAVRKAFELPPTKITSDFMQDLFVPMFSPHGSNMRAVEEALVMTWIHYFQHIEGELFLY